MATERELSSVLFRSGQSSVSCLLGGLEEERSRDAGLRGGRGGKEVGMQRPALPGPSWRVGGRRGDAVLQKQGELGRLESGGCGSMKRSH